MFRYPSPDDLPDPPLPDAWLNAFEAAGVEPWVVFLAFLSMGPITLSGIYSYIHAGFHWMSIYARERRLRAVAMTSRGRRDASGAHGALIAGSIVVSPGLFRQFVAGIRMILGGRIRPYQALLIRARREAVLRAKDAARAAGAAEIRNLRFHTAVIISNERRGVRALEVTAFGTAVTR